MGHRSGLKEAGAKGKSGAMALDVGEELRKGEAIDIAELCQAEIEKSVKTIVRVRDGRFTKPETKLRASQDLLDRAGGKPGTVSPDEDKGKVGGLKIVVNQLYVGEPRELSIDAEATEVEIELDDAPTAEELKEMGDATIIVKSPLDTLV